MRAVRWSAAAAAAALAVLTAAVPASAAPASAAPTPDAAATAAVPPGAVAWSVAHGSATASGHRWTEPGQVLFRDLVMAGQLTRSGAGCSSVWIQFTFDLAPAPARKLAQVCGGGSVDIDLRQRYMPTTTGRLTVCEGTETATDCAPWQTITSWPVNRD